MWWQLMEKAAEPGQMQVLAGLPPVLLPSPLGFSLPLRKKYCRIVSVKIQLINPEEKRISDYPGAVLIAGNCVCDESLQE